MVIYKLKSQDKILITGGAGFIGSHLCKKLVLDGFYVTCIDNLFTGSIDNIKNLLNYPNFKFIEQDVENEYNFEADIIFNLACPASPVHYQFNPIKTIKTNILGTINALELAKKYNAKIFQASTSEIYGDPLVHPQNENYWGNVNTIGIRSCYDEGKRVAETLMSDYHRMYNTNISIARIFNTYGVNMALNDGRVISNFTVQALKNEDITIYGDGSQTRSFCYVDDLIEGIIALVNKDNYFKPINLGNDSEYTILELAKLIIKLTNSNSKIIYKPLPSDDPVKRKPDLTRAKEILNYNPKISIEEGLIKTINYFSDTLRGKNK